MKWVGILILAVLVAGRGAKADEVTAADSENLKAFDSLLESRGPKKDGQKPTNNFRQTVIQEANKLQTEGQANDKEGELERDRKRRELLRRRILEALKKERSLIK
jgi:hypothetical protein